MSPRKFFSNGGRGNDSGIRKVAATVVEEVEEQRKEWYDSASTTEDVAVASKGSTTKVQTTRAGSMRSSSPSREHSLSWVTLPFSWARPKASVRDRDILDKSQKAAVARTKRGSDKEKRRSEKEAAREAEGGKKEWPEHLKWYYGANIPGYWVV